MQKKKKKMRGKKPYCRKKNERRAMRKGKKLGHPPDEFDPVLSICQRGKTP
jgi:hypothetical protein